MSTLRQAITDASDYTNPNVVKVVVDRNGDALYFSRSPIPFVARRSGHRPTSTSASTRTAASSCRRFAALPQTPLELAESLEQLRALEHGFRIRAVETCFESIEVDTPEDLERVRRHMAADRADMRRHDAAT